MYAGTKVAVGLLDVVSAGFLIFGILRIWSLTKDQPNDPRLNIPSLLLHFGAFALYLCGTVVLYYAFTKYAYFNHEGNMAPQTYLLTVTVSNYIATVA